MGYKDETNKKHLLEFGLKFKDVEINDIVSSTYLYVISNLSKTDKYDEITYNNVSEKLNKLFSDTFMSMNKITCNNLSSGMKSKLISKNYSLEVDELLPRQILGYGDFDIKGYVYFLNKKNQMEDIKKISYDEIIKLSLDCIDCVEIYNTFHTYLYHLDIILNKPLYKNCNPINMYFDKLKDKDFIKIVRKNLDKHSEEQQLYVTNCNREYETNVLKGLSKLLKREDNPLDKSKITEYINKYESICNIKYNEQQIHAITKALIKPITLIYGSAGTGKSTLLAGFSYVFENICNNKNIYYTAISGKAVLVLKKYIKPNENIKFMTIARLLSHNNIPQNSILVCDEASMIGHLHLLKFMQKFNKGNIILVGDIKQALPIKSSGQPFISLFNKDYMLDHRISLKYVKRQEEGSKLLKFIEEYSNNEEWTDEIKEYNGETEGIYKKIINTEEELCDFYIEFYNLHKNMICIQSQKVEEINKLIQEKINKNNKCHMIYGNKFYIKDRVMRVSNKIIESKNIFIPNGATGYIFHIDKYYVHISYDDINFEDDKIIKGQFLADFKLNYVQTIHKNQGSSSKNVLLHIPNNNNYSYNLIGQNISGKKNLLYTGLSRSSSLLIILCDDLYVLEKNKKNMFFTPIDDMDELID